MKNLSEKNLELNIGGPMLSHIHILCELCFVNFFFAKVFHFVNKIKKRIENIFHVFFPQ